MDRKDNAGSHPRGDWDEDLDAFVQLMQLSFTRLRPSADFEGGLRERLVRAAGELSGQRQPKKAPVSRTLLVGVAAAALSVVGAAGAGVVWWAWRSRLQQGSLLAQNG